MLAHVAGRVANTPLPPQNGLLPLFEAIINSIDAIDEAHIDDGAVDIFIRRNGQEHMFEDGAYQTENQIIGFEVVDNGEGFTDANFSSFNTSDSQWKIAKGGKGIGRFLWLKAFNNVEVESTYVEGERWKLRAFRFSLSRDGISDLNDTDAPVQQRKTVVKLNEFKAPYSSRVTGSADKIAQRIVEHCLEYFVLGRAPTITVHDTDSDAPINLSNLYREMITGSHRSEFKLREHEFTLTHFMVQARAGTGHRISYCANHRVVREDKITSSRISNLPSRLSIEDTNPSVYVGYVAGDYLDSNVNQERTAFHIPTEEDLPFEDGLSWNEIEHAVLQEANVYLKPYTEPVKVEKSKRIQEFVMTNAPQYRNLVKNHAERFDSIQPNISDTKLDLELYELQRQVEIELRKTGQELLQQTRTENNASEQTVEEFRKRFARFLEDWNDMGKANLARYIVHRKAMLTFLGQSLTLQREGKYLLENAIHEIIFPLRTTSDDIAYEQQNLWILDEKLTYHRYLASDMPLRKNEAVATESLDRPDLIVFDSPIAAVLEESAPYSSIVIFEFKRPMRDNFKDDDNPISQVYRYVQKIRDGNAQDKHGRPMRIQPTTPFYCYIVCDITKSLEEQAKSMNLLSTPDQEGFFGYNQSYHTYVEVISYDKLVRDAKRRNQLLFDKLNMHDEI